MSVLLEFLGQQRYTLVFPGALTENSPPCDLICRCVTQGGNGPMAHYGGFNREVYCALCADTAVHRITGIAIHYSDQVFADGGL